MRKISCHFNKKCALYREECGYTFFVSPCIMAVKGKPCFGKAQDEATTSRLIYFKPFAFNCPNYAWKSLKEPVTF